MPFFLRILCGRLLPATAAARNNAIEEVRSLVRPSTGEGRVVPPRLYGKGSRLLTEQQIARSWRKLLSRREFNEELAGKAEGLLGQLRPESPLRHRLNAELDELRRRSLQQQP